MTEIVALKTMHHPSKGTFRKDQKVDIEPRLADFYVSIGAAEYYETKVIREVPFPGAGEAQPSSVLPADRASTPTTASESDSGAPKKRGRKPKASS